MDGGLFMSDAAEQLCERAKLGDMAAASELVALHYERMFGFFRRQCANDEDAEDLTQRTFSKVWTALPSFAGRSSFLSWIHGIARNVYVDWRRKGNRLDPQPDDWWETCAAAGPSPFEDAAEKDLAVRLHAMVAELPEEQREAVHLHYYQGLSLKETAEVLGIATSTVKYRLRGALDELAQINKCKL